MPFDRGRHRAIDDDDARAISVFPALDLY